MDMAIPYMMHTADEIALERKRLRATKYLKGIERYLMMKLRDMAIYAREDFSGNDLTITLTVKLLESKPVQVVEMPKERPDNS
jgi:hypothetical protein